MAMLNHQGVPKSIPNIRQYTRHTKIYQNPRRLQEILQDAHDLMRCGTTVPINIRKHPKKEREEMEQNIDCIIALFNIESCVQKYSHAYRLWRLPLVMLGLFFPPRNGSKPSGKMVFQESSDQRPLFPYRPPRIHLPKPPNMQKPGWSRGGTLLDPCLTLRTVWRKTMYLTLSASRRSSSTQD